MNVEIGAEAAQFPEKEYINGIAVAVQGSLVPLHSKFSRTLHFSDVLSPFTSQFCLKFSHAPFTPVSIPFVTAPPPPTQPDFLVTPAVHSVL